MQYNNQAYLSLVWKDPKERKQYLIGRLSKGEEFVFKYDDEIKNALKAGFHPLLAFSNLKQEYHSKLMFPSFSSRLPDPKRKDINKILNKDNYGFFDNILMSNENIYNFTGRGGTSHKEVFDKIEEMIYENDEEVSLIFFLTDFESDIEHLWKSGKYRWIREIPLKLILTSKHKVPEFIDKSPIYI